MNHLPNDVSDEEVLLRDLELDLELVEEVSHEEMLRRIEAGRTKPE